MPPPCGHPYSEPPSVENGVECPFCAIRDIKFHRDRWAGPPPRVCIHLGEPTGDSRIQLNCFRDPPTQIPTRQCKAHGVCTEGTPARDTACCRYCSDKVLPAITGSLVPWVIRLDQHNVAPEIPGLRFNASLFRWQGRYLLAWRSGWEGSQIYITRLDDSFRPVAGIGNTVRLELTHARATYGREDPRLFVFRDRLHVSYVGVEGPNGPTSVLYACLTDDLQVERIYYPHLSARQPWEKSWAFFEADGGLKAVYHPVEHRIVSIDGDRAEMECQSETPRPWIGGEPRGGASPVRVGNRFYHWFHSRTGPDESPVYEYSLYTFSAVPPFRPLQIAPKPIVIADHNTKPADQYCDVVFPCGAEIVGDDWIVSLGVHDRHVELHRFTRSAVEGLLVNVE